MSSAGPSVVDAQEYHTKFQALRQDISDELKRCPPNTSLVKQKLADLKASLAEVSPLLPKYDQSQYATRIRELETALSAQVTGGQPARKFAFRSGGAKTTSTPNLAHLEGRAFTHDNVASGSRIPPGSSLSPPSAGPSSIPATAPATQPAESSSVIISNRNGDIIGPPAVGGPSSATGGYTLSLENLEQCVIDLRPTSSLDSRVDSSGSQTLTTLHAKGLKECVLLVPTMQGSAMLSYMDDCVIVLSAQQFRMHSSSDTTVLLGVASVPIIEGCRGLRIGAYPGCLGVEDKNTPSRHLEMQDFDWPQGRHSPNWSEMSGSASQEPRWATHAQERQFSSTEEALQWYRSILA